MCKKYGANFRFMAKGDVSVNPVFIYLLEKSKTKRVEWNFTKFLVDRHGSVKKVYTPQ